MYINTMLFIYKLSDFFNIIRVVNMNSNILNFLISDIGIHISISFILITLICIFLFFIILAIVMSEDNCRR